MRGRSPARYGVVAMIRLVMVRHGHVEGISPERFRGRQDVALSERGMREALAVADNVASRWKPAVVYTSPLQRCVRTGVAIAGACKARLDVLQDLNDLDYGDWQWRTHQEVEGRWPELFELWHSAPHRMRFPRGESLQHVGARVADALRFLLERHSGETVVLVGHDSSNRVMLLELLELPLSAYWRIDQDPCGVSEILVNTKHAKVLFLNETQHLKTGRFDALLRNP